jgi:hypothetical protein
MQNETITEFEYKASICFCSSGLPQFGGVNALIDCSSGDG